MANSYNSLRGRSSTSLAGGAGFNSLAAGNKSYGGGRPFPNSGKVGAEGKAGYAERDARREAILNRHRRS